MLDAHQVRAAIREVVNKYPAVEPYLRRVGERVAKSGVLQGRMKLGERLPNEVMSGLHRLFPNAALDTNLGRVTTLRLDSMQMAEEDAAIWIAALCAVFNIDRMLLVAPHERAVADATVLLDRCRLAFPDLLPIWDTEQSADIASMVKAHTALVVQQEYFQLAAATRFLLSDHEPMGMADFSARCFSDSKSLKSTPSLIRKLADWLLLLRVGIPGGVDEQTGDTFTDHGAKRRFIFTGDHRRIRG